MSSSKKMREEKMSLLKSNCWNYLKPGVQASTHDNIRGNFALYSLGFLAIILLLFCSVTSSVHSEVHNLEKCAFSFFSLFTTLCYRFYMVDGKLAGTSSIVKAISKFSSCIILVVPAVFVLQGWSTWISSAPYWAGLRSA